MNKLDETKVIDETKYEEVQLPWYKKYKTQLIMLALTGAGVLAGAKLGAKGKDNETYVDNELLERATDVANENTEA